MVHTPAPLITVTIKEETTLAAYLSRRGYRSNRIRQLLKFRAIAVNGATVTRYDHPLVPGDELVISPTEQGRVEDILRKSHIALLYEDDALIVIDKPPGLLSIGTERERTRTAYYQLNEYLKERAPERQERIFIVHRTDRETSGLLVFAKSERVKRALQQHWNNVDKRYLAVIEGVPRRKEDTIALPLRESKALKVHAARDDDEARSAVTRYRTLRAGHDYALLELALDTGRKNQIRVHLAQIGHPVAGDKKYGARTDPFGRLALHAHQLAFKHPVTGKPLRFRSELPWSFEKVVKTMKKAPLP
ncbi:MAG: RluA family pseudouridine synthase [Nitrospirota bacterium]